MKLTRIAVVASVLSMAGATAFAQEPPTFKMLDVDGDGSLTAEEFAKAKEGGMEKPFKEVDLDKDGKISAEEYESALGDCE